MIRSVVVYLGRKRDRPLLRKARVITPEISQVDCFECGGTGDWPYGSTPETCGPCIDCKGTGKIFV